MNTKHFDLENELRRQASAIRVDVPGDLSRAIRAAIASQVAESAPGAGHFHQDLASRSVRGQAGFAEAVRQHWALWAGITGAVAAALVGAFVFKGPTVQVDTHAEAMALAQEMRGVPERVLASLQQPVKGEDPLHEEATALASAGHSALGFLAYNFLPATNG